MAALGPVRVGWVTAASGLVLWCISSLRAWLADIWEQALEKDRVYLKGRDEVGGDHSGGCIKFAMA